MIIKYALLLAALVGIVIFTTQRYDNAPPKEPIMLTANKATTLKAWFGKESVTHKIAQGDSLRLIGLNEQNNTLWVETADGWRGYVPQEDVDDRFIVNSGEKSSSKTEGIDGDTVIIVGSDTSRIRFQCRLPNDSIVELHRDYVVGTTTFKYPQYCMNITTTGRASYMTRSKFERLFIGKTIHEADSLSRVALSVADTKEGRKAEYEINVFDPDNGRFHYPIVTLDENGRIASYELREESSKADWLLRRLPLVETLIDCDFTAKMIESNVYEKATLDSLPTWLYWLKMLALLVVFGIGWLLWMFFTGLIPMLVIVVLLCLRYPFYFVGDKTFCWIAGAVAVIFQYVWTVLAMCYGVYWFIQIPAAVVVTACTLFALINDLIYLPHPRCPHCRSLGSIVYQRSEQLGEHEEWREVTERGELVDSTTYKWDTWTDVTETKIYTDGRRTVNTRQKDLQHHSKTVNVYKWNVFDVKYLVKHMRNYYRCGKCGFVEYLDGNVDKELERKYKRTYIR